MTSPFISPAAGQRRTQGELKSSLPLHQHETSELTFYFTVYYFIIIIQLFYIHHFIIQLIYIQHPGDVSEYFESLRIIRASILQAGVHETELLALSLPQQRSLDPESLSSHYVLLSHRLLGRAAEQDAESCLGSAPSAWLQT